jgi:hypothetical protein
MHPVTQAQEEERQELQTLLESGIFMKAPNLQRFLEYVAEKYFAGEAEEVKEYQIAVEALNRPTDFNPQSDTIVRVTAHSRRKRLAQYYSREGSDHPTRVELPSGRYLLRFVHHSQEHSPYSHPDKPETALLAIATNTRRKLHCALAALLLLAVVVAAPFAYQTYRTKPIRADGNSLRVAPATTPPVPPEAVVRFLVGENHHPYTDQSGQTWMADQFCKGGTSIPPNDHHIQGTGEDELFRGGRNGSIHCRIPVPNGSYESRILFADTEGKEEAMRQVALTINGGPPQTLDVVDLAGGNDIATERVYAGIHPSADGTIHLDFEGEGSFGNSVELLPAPSNRMLPIRLHAGPVAFRDSSGNVWSPDSFFSGGRRVFHAEVLAGHRDAALFQWERYGHFHYSIPVAAKREYTVTIYFTEAWFGAPNGAPGGVESRVFEVYGDGTTLLNSFDIFQQQKNGIAKATFHHVKPTSQDLIDLYFAPTTNYALVNAIEIEDES